MILNQYDQYFENWKSGIKHEIAFWDRLFATNGRCGGNPDVYKYRMDPKCPFQLSDDLENVNSKIIDVGSGPYSRIGFYIGGKKLDVTLTDPLAAVYRAIGKKYNVTYPLEVQTGMVELLHLIYGKSVFDFAHMSNSLDHCFDPVRGIMELLYITKVGGKIILRHSDNEAAHEKYKGFHQWNLTIHDGKFIIWRPDHKPIDVENVIKKYATIECTNNCIEELYDDQWVYNKVVIRKQHELDLKEFDVETILINLIETVVMEHVNYN